MDKPLISKYVHRMGGRWVAYVEIGRSVGFKPGSSELRVQHSTDWATAPPCLPLKITNCFLFDIKMCSSTKIIAFSSAVKIDETSGSWNCLECGPITAAAATVPPSLDLAVNIVMCFRYFSKISLNVVGQLFWVLCHEPTRTELKSVRQRKMICLNWARS